MAATSFDDLPNDALRVIFQWLSQDSGSDAVYTTVQLAGTRFYFSDLADVVRITTPDNHKTSTMSNSGKFNDGAMYYNGNVWLPSLVCKRFRAISKEIRHEWYRTKDLLDSDERCSVMKVMVYNIFGPGKHCLYTFQTSGGRIYVPGLGGFDPYFGVSLYLGPEKGHVQVMSNLSVAKYDTPYNKAYFAVFHAVRRYLLTGNSQNMALSHKLSYKQSQALSYRFVVHGFINNKPDS